MVDYKKRCRDCAYLVANSRKWFCDNYEKPCSEVNKCSEVEEEQDWYFTFGCGQCYGDRRSKYVKIHGTFESAREKMILWYGKKWCTQYDSNEIARIIAKYGTTEYKENIDFDDFD